ncbi:MAG: glycerophosphodiester phosphodiesterase [Firmicutes bacterium HGW-Firmicutes-21]|nr:MAG: glycerophosphodiester phosphodiesterase [Firmicutes bacterium HGW-Firmicutes-21]
MIYTAIWAHRGASAYAPENTLPAFLLAERLGSDGIELDVQITKDKQVVVCHDHNIDRTSNGTGNICDMTLEELKQYDFGYPTAFGHRFAGTKISTLGELYEAVKASDMIVNVELKYTAAQPDTVALTLAVTEQHGMKDRVIYSSFAHYGLEAVMKLDSTAVVAPLYGDMENACEAALAYGALALHPAHSAAVKPGYINEAHLKGLRVHPYTIDNPAIMQELLNLGADALITNYPDIAKGLRDKHLKKFI